MIYHGKHLSLDATCVGRCGNEIPEDSVGALLEQLNALYEALPDHDILHHIPDRKFPHLCDQCAVALGYSSGPNDDPAASFERFLRDYTARP